MRIYILKVRQTLNSKWEVVYASSKYDQVFDYARQFIEGMVAYMVAVKSVTVKLEDSDEL